MVVTNKEYKGIDEQQRAEYLVVAREEKINIMSNYFLSADDLLTRISRMPAQDDPNFDREIGRLEMAMEEYNVPVYPALLGGILAVNLLATNHTDTVARFKVPSYTTPTGVAFTAMEKLKSPLSTEVELLVKEGIFIPPTTVGDSIIEGRVIGSTNRFNKMAEKVSKLTDSKRKRDLSQALVNYIDSSDPIGGTLRQFSSDLLGVEPKKDIRLSRLIWGADRRDQILNKVITDSNNGIAPSETVKELEETLKKAGVGGTYYKAERVVDTELQNGYALTKADGGREFNKQYGRDPLVIERRLSAAHKMKDICDEMTGFYSLDGSVPNGALHGNCICIVTMKYLSDVQGEVRNLDGATYSSGGVSFPLV